MAHILVKWLPSRLPAFHHASQLGGDPLPVGGQVFQSRVADRGDPIRHVADRVQVDRQTPVHQVFADTAEMIPYAVMSETSSNCWKFSVINEASCSEYLVDTPSRTSWMAA